jgi:hypothetical protein
MVTWDGRKTDQSYAPDGDYRLVAIPRDRAGNTGTRASAEVSVRTSLRAPVATPALFLARDGDALAPATRLEIALTRAAIVTWKVLDATGA